MVNPLQSYWYPMRKNFIDICGTLIHGLLFMPYSQFLLQGFIDVYCASCIDYRHSTLGIICYLGASPIVLSSKKKSTISCSST